jgi:hypothetical protein
MRADLCFDLQVTALRLSPGKHNSVGRGELDNTEIDKIEIE